jgi:hypothetical protein
MKQYSKKLKTSEAEIKGEDEIQEDGNTSEVNLPPYSSPRTYFECEQALIELEAKLQSLMSSPSKQNTRE